MQVDYGLMGIKHSIFWLGVEHLSFCTLALNCAWSLLNVECIVPYSELSSYQALQSLWGPGEYQVEIDEMLAERAASKGVQVKSLLEFLQDRSIKGQIMAIAVISACIQLSGLSAVRRESLTYLSGRVLHWTRFTPKTICNYSIIKVC